MRRDSADVSLNSVPLNYTDRRHTLTTNSPNNIQRFNSELNFLQNSDT
jgi:hypothetical protein